MYSYNLGNSLIETVNELGSIFYGPILGVFLVALFLKRITNGSAVFYATVLTQLLIFAIYIPAKMKLIGLGFLWLNPIGAFGVVLFALLLQPIMTKEKSRYKRDLKYFLKRYYFISFCNFSFKAT
jgi:hypothetical protein